MQRILKFAGNYLPTSLNNFLRKSFGKSLTHKFGTYSKIVLSDGDIANGEYKSYLGGGSDAWELRGAFQLHFLKNMGMLKTSRLLDVGCGPGRASKHLIEFLDCNKYYGVDYNADFIKAARLMSEENRLHLKNPVFEVVKDFNFRQIEAVFDFVNVFSVLNHCDSHQKALFFDMVSKPLRKGGKVFISHASWFDKSYVKDTDIKQTNQLTPNEFDITKFGWNRKDEVFPIIELTKV